MPSTRVTQTHLRPVPGSPEARLRNILNKIPDKQVRCRSAHHKWARDQQEPGQPFPREVSAQPAREGCYLIIDPCLRCDAEKHVLTGPGGDMYGGRSWIIYPHDWERIPSDYPHGKLTLLAEWDRRNNTNYTQLFRSADRAAREEQLSVVRPVTFSSAS